MFILFVKGTAFGTAPLCYRRDPTRRCCNLLHPENQRQWQSCTCMHLFFLADQLIIHYDVRVGWRITDSVRAVMRLEWTPNVSRGGSRGRGKWLFPFLAKGDFFSSACGVQHPCLALICSGCVVALSFCAQPSEMKSFIAMSVLRSTSHTLTEVILRVMAAAMPPVPYDYRHSFSARPRATQDRFEKCGNASISRISLGLPNYSINGLLERC